MRDYPIWSVTILATVVTACSESPKQPPEQRSPTQGIGAGGKAEGPPKELTVDLGGGVKMEFVLIPAGSFMMGDEKGDYFEKPVHKVTITKPFYLGKYEVTQEQWEAVMGNNPSHHKGPKNPVEQVSWGDCRTFLKKLNAKLAVRGEKYSLPTEAQWEYACRAGTTTRYSFGDDAAVVGDHAWWSGNSEGTTHPVGQKKPNAWRLYDMHGNVREWCSDRWHQDYYGISPAHDPTGWDLGALSFIVSDRVFRGGCWGDGPGGYPDYFRCGARQCGPDDSYYTVGFRVARSLAP